MTSYSCRCFVLDDKIRVLIHIYNSIIFLTIVSGMNLKYEPGRQGKAGFQISGDYYNRTLAGWEPLIEQWRYDNMKVFLFSLQKAS